MPMRTGELASAMRLLGLWFVLALVAPVRVDGRSVLLPIFAVLVVVWLRRMRPIVSSTRLRKAYRAAFWSAVVVALGSALALVPAVEPGGASALLLLVIIFGTASYASLLAEWCREAHWSTARHKATVARTWLVVDLALVVVSIFTFLLLEDPGPEPAHPAFDQVHSMFARPLEGWLPVAVAVAIGLVWLVALVLLSAASKTIRQGLTKDPTAVVAPY